MIMKKLLLSIGLVVVAALSMNAQTLKFGHFDSNEFLEKMPAIKEVQKTLDEEQSKVEGIVTTLNEDFQKMYQEYQQKAGSMTDAQRQEKEAELEAAYSKIQQYVQQARQDIQAKQRELMAPIMQKVMRAVQEVGVEQGFIYIFEEKAGIAPFVSEAKSVDIAPFVKKKLGI